MDYEFRNKTAIVGIGISEVSRLLPYGAGAMVADAVRNAVKDAGLQLSDIDGMATTSGTAEYGSNSQKIDGVDICSIQYAVEILGLKSVDWFAEVTTGAALSPLASALYAVHSGRAKYAVVYRSFRRPRGRGFGARTENVVGGIDQFFLPYGYGNAYQYAAMALNRYMYDYGLTKEHIGEYVIHCHKQAFLNDHAILKQEISMDEYLNYPCIAGPMSKLDCDVPLDGAMALIVTTADRAKDLKQKPVYVSDVQHEISSNPVWEFSTAPELTQVASYNVCRNLWKQAGFDVKDLGFVQLYDGFSFFPFIWASHLGMCNPNEMGDYIVEACRHGKEAKIPLTTNGGSLCEGRFHGMGQIVESVLQLQGRAGLRQLPDVRTGVATIGGFSVAGAIALQSE